MISVHIQCFENWEIYKECKREISKLGLMLNYIHLKKTTIFETGLHIPTCRCLRMHFALKLLQSHCLDLPKQNLLGRKYGRMTVGLKFGNIFIQSILILWSIHNHFCEIKEQILQTVQWFKKCKQKVIWWQCCLCKSNTIGFA